MNTKVFLTVLTVATTLGACGGGGGGGDSGTSQTASDTQTRTSLEPANAIEFVQLAHEHTAQLLTFSRFLTVLAPSTTAASSREQKDVGYAPCQLVFIGENCKGRFRFETEFPVTQAQQSLRAGSTLLVDSESIVPNEQWTAAPIENRNTFQFKTLMTLTPELSGEFDHAVNQTAPSPFRSNDTFRFEKVTTRQSSSSGGVTISGVYVVSPDAATPVDLSQTVSFANWAVFRTELAPGALVTMYSTKYVDGTVSPLTRKMKITVTVVSSDTSRTEYRVSAKSDADDLGTTRTVIGTLDSSGRLVYTAS